MKKWRVQIWPFWCCSAWHRRRRVDDHRAIVVICCVWLHIDRSTYQKNQSETISKVKVFALLKVDSFFFCCFWSNQKKTSTTLSNRKSHSKVNDLVMFHNYIILKRFWRNNMNESALCSPWRCVEEIFIVSRESTISAAAAARTSENSLRDFLDFTRDFCAARAIVSWNLDEKNFRVEI